MSIIYYILLFTIDSEAFEETAEQPPLSRAPYYPARSVHSHHRVYLYARYSTRIILESA